jgi:type II secretion system protein F
MPLYTYQVKKTPQETLSGTLEAESQQAALIRLREMGYHPLAIDEQKANREAKVVASERFSRIRQRDVNLFFRQLANLCDAGLPLIRALTTLISETENPKMVDVLRQLRAGIQKGRTLAECLADHPKVFPSMYSKMVHAGETGGMLEEVLVRIATFGDKSEDLKSKVKGALIYPIFLVTVGALALFILLSFVFPKFISIFDDLNVDLPIATSIVMAICDFMSRFWAFILAGVAALFIGLRQYIATPGGRFKVDKALLRAPVFGPVAQRVEISKFARTLGTLIDNGVPILSALRIVVETLTNKALAKEVDSIHDEVSEGDSLNDTLRKREHFPPSVVNMLAIGEESGMLGEACKRIADVYDEEVDRAIKAMTSLLEPMLILVMGFFVGFLVIAMLLPMFQVSSLIQ